MILLIRSRVNHDGFPKCILRESSALATLFRNLESFEIADGVERMLSQVSLYRSWDSHTFRNSDPGLFAGRDGFVFP